MTSADAPAAPLAGKWGPGAAAFVDEAGHLIKAKFDHPVVWDTDQQEQLRITAWDDEDQFRLADDPRFRVSARLIKRRLKSLTDERTGTIRGDILEPLHLTGIVNWAGPNDHFPRLMTEDSDYIFQIG